MMKNIVRFFGCWIIWPYFALCAATKDEIDDPNDAFMHSIGLIFAGALIFLFCMLTFADLADHHWHFSENYRVVPVAIASFYFPFGLICCFRSFFPKRKNTTKK